MAEELLHLSSHDRQAIRALIKDIHSQFGQNIIQLIFFGSKARGDGVEDSDIDLLLVTNQEDWEFRHEVLRRGARLSLEYGVLFNLFVVSKFRWNKMEQIRYPLYRTISNEGITLHQGSVAI